MQHDPRFLKGVDQFNRRLFYECHETLEEIWLEENGYEREFYQGIIQVAAGYFKWEQDVPVGALKLLRSGLVRLRRYAPSCLGLDIAAFIEGVESDVRMLEAPRRGDEVSAELGLPLLCFEHPVSDR